MVLPDSNQITRVWSYSGNYKYFYKYFKIQDFHFLWLSIQTYSLSIYKYIQIISLSVYNSYNPINTKATYTYLMVWAVPVSLVTTKGISIDLFSNAT